MKYEYGESVE